MADWDAYRIFLAVAEHGSHTRAAKALGTSQPTVSRAIAALESKLRVRLFIRTGRALLPSPAGEAMLEHVRRMADAANDATRRATGGSGALEGVVRISITEGLGALWLTRRIADLRALHPGLRVELVIDNHAVDLGRGDADLAIRLFRPREPDLVARRIGRLTFGLFASPAYLELRGKPRRLADLAKHDLIGFSSRGFRPPFADWWHRLAPTERFVLLTSNLLAQHEAARAGVGICLATEALLAGDPRLARVLPRLRPPSLDVHLVVHADVRSSPRVAAVHAALSRMLAEVSR